MISVVCYLWNDDHIAARTPRGKPREFHPSHVNTMANMFERHLTQPHRFICVADKPDGLSPKVEFVKLPDEAAALGRIRSPEGDRFPSCYRRLWSFSEEAKAILGERILVGDIDLVTTAPIDPILEYEADFVGWRPFRDWGAKKRFGGGLYLLRTGTRAQVWKDFKGAPSIQSARAAGFRGSDQAWISYKLADRDMYWPKNTGLYSVRDFGPGMELPKDSRLVQFNGPLKPWHYCKGAPRMGSPWVRQHWR